MLVASRVSSENMEKLLKKEQMFELRDHLVQAGDLSQFKLLYYEAYLDNAFGRPKESNRKIDKLASLYAKKMSKKKLAELMMVKSNNHIKLFEYAHSVDALSRALEMRSTSKDAKDIRNTIKLWSALTDVPAQVVHHTGETSVAAVRNSFNHLLIPVCGTGQDTIEFVFDSGANLSTIRRGIAQRMGVVFTGSKIDVGNSVGSKVESEYGYIPRLSIGNLVVENVVVLVVPDKMLTFETANYTIDGIIGFPVIHAFGEFSITRDGKLLIAAQNSIGVEQNLFTKGLTPYVKVDFKEESLTMLFDTGAMSSNLSRRYYKSHKQEVKSNAEIKNTVIAGAGKEKKVKNYELANVSLRVSNSQITLPKIDVHRSKLFRDKNCDGFFGQDAMQQQREMVMNLRDMYTFFRD